MVKSDREGTCMAGGSSTARLRTPCPSPCPQMSPPVPQRQPGDSVPTQLCQEGPRPQHQGLHLFVKRTMFCLFPSKCCANI